MPDLSLRALEFHPAAPRPNMVWTVSLPTNWAFLDTRPDAWSRSMDRIIDDFYLGRRLRPAERRTLREKVEATVKGAQEAKVLMSFLLPGATDEGEVATSSLFLRWANTAPRRAGLRMITDTFAAGKDLSSHQSRFGQSYAMFSEVVKVGPYTDRRDMWNHQAFIPVESTTWTLLVSASAPSEGTSEPVRQVVARVAESFRAYLAHDGESSTLFAPEAAGDIVVDSSEGTSTNHAAIQKMEG